jgi:hypothetical protein
MEECTKAGEGEEWREREMIRRRERVGRRKRNNHHCSSSVLSLLGESHSHEDPYA